MCFDQIYRIIVKMAENKIICLNIGLVPLEFQGCCSFYDKCVLKGGMYVSVDIP